MSELGARGRGHEVDLRGQVVVLRRVHGNSGKGSMAVELESIRTGKKELLLGRIRFAGDSRHEEDS
jgi:hypothetical protein